MKIKLAFTAAALAATAISTAAPAAAITNIGYFNPTSTDYRAYTGISLTETETVAQSFGFDESQKTLYIAQTSPGEWARAQGNLTITRTSSSDPTKDFGVMRLVNFGHAGTIGVQPNPNGVGTPKDAFLWVDCKPAIPSATTDEARGRALCRLRFHPGWTITYNQGSGTFTAKDAAGTAKSISVAVFQPGGAQTLDYSANTDIANGRIIVRYRVSSETGDGSYRFRVYSIDDLANGQYSNVLAEHVQPTRQRLASDFTTLTEADRTAIAQQSFQSFAIYGSYLYLLYGKLGDSSHTFITRFNLNNGSIKSALTPLNEANAAAAAGRSHWEAEGMAIRYVSATDVRLRWGLSLKPSPRKLAIYEKRLA